MNKTLRFYLAIVFVFMAFSTPQPAQAAGIVVNTAVDENNTGTDCSLREAIIAANTDSAYGGCPAGAGSDAITFSGNYTITLAGSQLPVVSSTITITGNGAANTIIEANAASVTATYRVFEVGSAGNLTLDGLTVRHGRCEGSCPTASEYGGGIYNAGTLSVSNVTFSGNTANGRGGGMYNFESSATLTNVTFSTNGAFNGGGMYNDNSNPTLTNVTFSTNGAFSGGGMYNDESTPTLTNVTFSTNTANYGGGMYNSLSAPTLTNVTFSGNSVNMDGGGMYNTESFPTLTNVTFSGNSANGNGGGMLNNGSNSNPMLKNVILANSISGGDCINIGGASLNVASSHNLIESTEGGACGLTDGVNGNLIGSADPALNPLADNGGATQTFSLQLSSDALNNGTNVGCPATDQRGVTRPQNGSCDIGAYESNAQTGPTFVINTDEDTDDGFCDAYIAALSDCTLREAMTYASNLGGTDTITFADDYTITLGSQLPTVIDAIIINGNGASNTIIQADAAPNTANYRVFSVTTGSLTLNQVTVRHGVSSGIGGGFLVSFGGTLNLNNSLVSANNAGDGGAGLYNNLGTVNITNSTFSDNSTISTSGGGAITNAGTMTISNSTITRNTATNGTSVAGGIRNIGDLTATLNIYNSTISDNVSNSGVFDGSNIFQDSGTLNLYNTIIANGSDGDCGFVGGTINATLTLIESTGTQACGLTTGPNGNMIGSDPMLGSLTGSPAYYPLLSGSPAINTGNNGICAAAPVNNQSQNGVTRPQGPVCDIGSFEKLSTATFVDVPTNAFGWSHIESIYAAGITGGCSTVPLNYCPNNTVSRAQMAVFLLRGINGSAYSPPPATGTVFNDVPSNAFAASFIEAFSAAGITGGCGGGNYCPNNTVTRAQMAVFLLRAKYGASYTPPTATGMMFTDVPLSHPFATWIEQLASEGITGGCGAGNYCPNNSVTRAQMAIFIQRTFSLPLP